MNAANMIGSMNKRTRSCRQAAVVAIALLFPVNAMARDAFYDGPILWIESRTNPVFDQAKRCGLNVEALRVTEQVYQVTPRTDEQAAALETRLLEIGELAGFGRDPAQRPISRAFLRTMLTTRTLMTVNYEAPDDRDGLTCLGRWLAAEGFRQVGAAEADDIRRKATN